MNIEGHAYEFTIGSDIKRDGMFVEAARVIDGQLTEVAEIFYSDATGQFFLSCYEQDLPLALIDELIRCARQRLPHASTDASSTSSNREA